MASNRVVTRAAGRRDLSRPGSSGRKRRSGPPGLTPPGPTARASKGVFLFVCCSVIIIPLISVIATSLADEKQINASGGFVLWPSHPTLQAYTTVFENPVVLHSAFVSICITLVGTTLSLACTSLLAYSLSRPGTLAHKPVLLMVLFTLLFSPGIIPSYLMVKELGLLNSYWALLLPVMLDGFNVIVMRAFFLELPQEILDAARVDGAGELQTFWRIVLPLSKPVLAVVGLFSAVGYWNNFFTALLYISDTTKWPLQLVLNTYVVKQNSLNLKFIPGHAPPPPESIQMAILVIAIVPILVAYPFIQRHFKKGVLVGSVKG
ncbi:multiple sugar transport system permease protein/putative aldouronate transport system permease protein [Actinopolymorpha cephalotaxi]|uniref:Multiple sugar transport system permease protein/putative aldouronate transport system permease protein n=1 Tax=Actinopolymorpha cephalotaxi TaxID=504797 RepID=A0A1I2ZXD5_9ACTN|nr:carbohydrate ABC transporter permease [Actinopolymorpha cephalotaxi]NYH84217.1 multiple sugar transport system permease protein/putative aldouronate transport system permease protein [Actinopolymorpha cephalotaxi]SFH42340.1 multiple sugar transport system permease protein/putative aldouronate transport system permease protein [Actinopolymorpha cephalotaxi]